MAAKAGKAPGTATLIASAGALTILAATGGGLVGKVVAAKLHDGAGAPGQSEAAAKPSPYANDTELRELPSVVINLAEPAQTRVRLQVAIVYPKKATDKPEILASQVADDIVAYVKTLSVAQLQGATGLQALREDLNDRAVTRSGGKVREVLIENLVVQ